MKTITEIRNAFWRSLQDERPDLAKLRRTRKKQNDYPTDVRVYFVDYVDHLRRNLQITENLAKRVTL